MFSLTYLLIKKALVHTGSQGSIFVKIISKYCIYIKGLHDFSLSFRIKYPTLIVVINHPFAHSTINHDRLTGDELSFRTGEKTYHLGNVLNGSYVSSEMLGMIFRAQFILTRMNPTRCNRIDTYFTDLNCWLRHGSKHRDRLWHCYTLRYSFAIERHVKRECL